MNARINPFRGTGIALVTPFTLQNEVDYPALKRLVNHCIDGGVDFLVALGTTAETATLTSDEKQRVVAAVCDAAAGRVPVVQGVGGNDSAKVAAELKAGLQLGISGVLSVSPYYNKPTQEGIYRHFIHISAATDLPIILYNVPGRTGSNMAVETTLRIAHEVPHAVAIKEASGNLEQAMTIVLGAPEGFDVLSGDDNLTLPLVACGAHGVISVSGQAFPKTFSQMVRDARAGSLDAAQVGHYAMLGFTQQLFAEGNPGGIKSALAHLGIIHPALRLPLWPVSPQLDAALAQSVHKLQQHEL
ncbi:MAG: 4-hydroxy-tetrahydrodipicolinate synthase [Cryomorphaceae bacterium]|nr:4-hydroxy-tetrahydrodipicolinate synthase [Cryomorphaceae bacterium]